MSNKRESIDLIEYMETETKIDCQNRGCDKEEVEWCGDEVDFAKDLWKRGWRISRQGTLYCPKCAKKKLKQ